MILKLLVVFGIFEAVSTRGFRTDKDEFYPDEGFAGLVSKSLNGLGVGGVAGGGGGGGKEGGEDVGLLEKGKVAVEGGKEVQEHDGEKRRKFVNGRNGHFQTVNVSLDYPTTTSTAGNENVTWNVEKKEKPLDLGKEVIRTCQVTTEELVATAQATVTRALKGLCNAKDIDERFEDLENSITTQLNILKQMIINLEDRLGDHGDAVLYGQKQLSAAISKGLIGGGNGNGGTTTTNDFMNKNQKPPHDYAGTKVSPNGKEIKNSDDDDEDEEVSGTRDPEILKFNSSIHMETNLNGAPKKVFTYYWKIKDMMFKLSGWNPRKSLRSQSFYIFPSGYRMYMRIFPRKNDDNFYVRVGLTKGEFDDSLKWPFPLKHKIHILDQTKEGRLFEDIASRIWDPNLLCSDFNWQKPIKGDNHECVEIGFPHDVLRQREYIRQNALVIKLTVYLES